LPGSGGAADIASLAKRFVVIIEHNDRRLVEHVSYVTSPGNGDGPSSRANLGLVRGGPSAIITTMGVLRFGSESAEARLELIHPGVSADEVKQNTGWPLAVAAAIATTPQPTDEELRIIRDIDPQRFWTS